MEQIENFLSSHPYAAETERTYRNILEQFLLEEQNPQTITVSGLVTYIKSKTRWKNARQRVAVSCIKTFLSWTYGQSHPALNAKIKRIGGRVPRTITMQQLEILQASFDTTTAKGARDLAITSTLADTALRLSEICNLQQADTDTEHGVLQALVKGGKWRFAIFTPYTAADIEHWKLFRERINPRGHLFVHHQTGEPLTPGGLSSIIREWGRKVGFEISAHDFRRGFATMGSENGAPHRAIMAGGGWTHESMITMYTRRFDLEAMRQWLPMSKISRERV